MMLQEMRDAAASEEEEGKNMISSEMTLDGNNEKSAADHHNKDDNDKDLEQLLSSSGYSSSSMEGSFGEKGLSGSNVPSYPMEGKKKNCQVQMSGTDSCASFQVSYLGKIALDKEALSSILCSTDKKGSLAKILDKVDQKPNEDDDDGARALLEVKSGGLSVKRKEKIFVSHGLRTLRMWSPIDGERALFALVAQDTCHVIACGDKADAAELSKRLREMVRLARKADSEKKSRDSCSSVMSDFCDGKRTPNPVMSKSLPSRDYFESEPLPKRIFKRLKYLGVVVVNRAVGIDLIHGAVDVASANGAPTNNVTMSVSTASLSIREPNKDSSSSSSSTEIRLSKVTFMGISESCPSKFAFIAEEGGSFSAHVFDCATVEAAGSLSRALREACEERYRIKCEVERGKEEILGSSLVGRALLKWRGRIVRRRGRQK